MLNGKTIVNSDDVYDINNNTSSNELNDMNASKWIKLVKRFSYDNEFDQLHPSELNGIKTMTIIERNGVTNTN